MLIFITIEYHFKFIKIELQIQSRFVMFFALTWHNFHLETISKSCFKNSRQLSQYIHCNKTSNSFQTNCFCITVNFSGGIHKSRGVETCGYR